MWLIRYKLDRWRKRNPELMWYIETALIGLGVGIAIVMICLLVGLFFPYQPL